MISKKNKALAAGVLSAAMSATALVPAFASGFDATPNEYAKEKDSYKSYATMFETLYDDVITNGIENGYMSDQTQNSSFGIPYHAVETLVVEAPDYGHETTSEAMSYMAWVTAMHDVLANKGVISGSAGDLEKGWRTLEAIIPGWSEIAYGYGDIEYNTIWEQERLKADTATEENDPKLYPATQNGTDAINPIYEDMKSAYGGEDGYYLMHWLADVDDWYGFGGGKGQFTFINTFQRGEQESCFETVPHPCLEELKYGMDGGEGDNGNGIKAIFNGKDKVPPQYSFTNAPDAEDRAIQAIYFASNFGVNCGDLSYLAGKMGDQCRNDMFDKYYKEIGCQNMASSSAGLKSQHYLMSWYTSWGGALTASYGDYQWAWQIGCSHSHQFYQNPLAAYALAYDKNMGDGIKTKNFQSDYEESLKRQIEMYLWLQSANGPYAGGCTNSKNGKYEKYDADESTFYDMVYVEHPVYADPGSNHWIGNQVWSTQRLAELYYYVMTKGDESGQTYGGLSLEEALDALLSRWVEWFIENTKFDYTTEDGKELAYAIPATLDWKGQPETWGGKYDPDANSGLTCTIRNYGMGDIGCVSSLCNTLIFYAAAKGVDGSAATEGGSSVAEQGLLLANKLMSAQWNLGRDEIGIAFEDCNGSLTRIFDQEVYIPDYYSGTMPDGSKLEPGATFSSIRESYAKDPMYQECKKVYDATGETEDYKYKLHRFWHMGDAIMTTGTFALLYPDVVPYYSGEEPTTQPTTEPTEAPTTAAPQPTEPTEAPSVPSVPATLYGDANNDGKITIADAAAILQTLSNSDKYPLSEQGAANSDVNGVTGITVDDAIVIMKIDAKLLEASELPLKA